MKAGASALGAVGAVVLALLSGCVVPQDTQPLEEFVLLNRPPRILENAGMYPTELRSDIGNCPVVFSAFVEDPDTDDRLRFRFYLDYDPNQQFRKLPYSDGRIEPNGQAVRSTAATLELTLEDFPVLKDQRTHIVTLLVTDGTLEASQGPRSTPDPDPVPGVDAGNPRYAVSYSWIVDENPTLPCLTPQ